MSSTGGKLLFTTEDAWRKLMFRIGVTNPGLVKKGARLLDQVDRLTHSNSKMPG